MGSIATLFSNQRSQTPAKPQPEPQQPSREALEAVFQQRCADQKNGSSDPIKS